MNFQSRLRQLRKEMNMTQEELAQKLNITKANISKYETGRIQPNIETLTFLSNFFNVSIDYLLGRTDHRKLIINPEGNLDNQNNKYKSYDEISNKIKNKLVNEGLIEFDQPIPEKYLNIMMDEFREKSKDRLLSWKIIDRIRKKLMENNILDENDPITLDIIDLIFEHGENAAIEILKLKKKHDK
ncbi:helix-turn-helix domain-containing protein [Maledivibacter halophilus]|uniref:DNA-binding transcriptional regulator, XRE-family HTH domain n=1 Tax=Maledivibacter halophilus TaxID=36842 RepID=A0A1T5KEL5_9FIRM|nr:helix-turn-helix transcriptional regulator [Maledivibacter halophilus]SKC61798.1 DNA-binding transcriptional regulator, XRE-family HTH domain [Maledivibacter halophilus]